MAGQSPVTARERRHRTGGGPDDTTTDTVLPSLSFVPGRGVWLRIWPAGAVIEVLVAHDGHGEVVVGQGGVGLGRGEAR